MGWVDKVRAAGFGFKELTAGHPTAPLTPWWWTPAGRLDTRAVGNGQANSAVQMSLGTLIDAFTEAKLKVVEETEPDQWEPVGAHPATDLLEEPTPEHPQIDGDLLLGWALAAMRVDGDAFVFKVRSAANRVVELWPLPTSMMTEVYPLDGSRFLDAWKYTPGARSIDLPPGDVVQLRTRIDPDNFRRGLARLKTVLREILTDEEAAAYSAALLKNLGVPGVILRPRDPNDPGPSPEEADALREDWAEKFGGSKRGEPYIDVGGFDVSVVSFSPEQMMLDRLRQIPEERISGAIGVPAVLAGLGAGLKRATYANVDGLREFWTRNTIVPLWRKIARQLTRQLLREFDENPRRRLDFDLSEVSALQEDQDAMATRWSSLVSGGIATVAEGRRPFGLPVEDHHDVFLRAVGMVETPNMPVEGAPPSAEELEGMLVDDE